MLQLILLIGLTGGLVLLHVVLVISGEQDSVSVVILEMLDAMERDPSREDALIMSV